MNRKFKDNAFQIPPASIKHLDWNSAPRVLYLFNFFGKSWNEIEFTWWQTSPKKTFNEFLAYNAVLRRIVYGGKETIAISRQVLKIPCMLL